jgi:hypothetical protein
VAPKKKKQKAKPPARKKYDSTWYWIGYWLLAAALIVHVRMVINYDFTQDDAFITFRYAENFLNGHGLVYNIGERVEGFTNFLWTIMMILGGRLGIDYVDFSQILGTAFGLGTIIMLFLIGYLAENRLPRKRRLFLAGLSCLILGGTYSFAYWTVAGLETAAFSFMVVSSLYFYMRRSFLVIPGLVLATLLRPEGGLVFVFVILYDIFSKKSLTRYAITILSVYIIFLLPLAVFKLTYYGSLFPNPFYAKTSFNIQQVIHGLEYTGEFFWHYLAAGLFVIPAIILFKKLSRPLRIAMIFLLVYTIYITLIGGDVLKVHRFFVPLFPLFALVAVFGVNKIFNNKPLFMLGIILLVVWQMVVPRNHVSTFHGREKGLAVKMILLMNNLLANDKTDFSVAASTIGMVGYKLIDHTIIDMLGLTDSTIARHPEPSIEGLESTWKEMQYNSRYLLSRQPDYILFSTGNKPSAPAERALFLYGSFLNNYRGIGFFLATKLHSIYKRYYPLEGEITRDVDPAFVQNYNLGINLIGEDKQGNAQALTALNEAMKYSPQPTYPYLYYYIAEANRKLGKFQVSYKILKQAAELDTLVYEVYKDLYLYEYRLGNYLIADQYRSRVASLVPWYMPRLDSLVKQIR